MCKRLLEVAAGHERIDEAGLLPVALMREAEAEERHEALVPVAAQHRHLPQHLPQALQGRLVRGPGRVSRVTAERARAPSDG